MILLMMPNIDLRMVDNRNETFWNNVIFAKKHTQRLEHVQHAYEILKKRIIHQVYWILLIRLLVHKRFLWEYNHSLISSQTTFFELFEYIVIFFYEYSEFLLTFITWLYMYELIYDDPHQILYHDLSLVYPLLLLL